MTHTRFRIGALLAMFAFGLVFAGIVLAASPIAQSQSVQTDESVNKTITLTATEDLAALTYTVTSLPSHGSLDNTSGSMACDTSSPAICTVDVLYTPVAGQWQDSFTFMVNNPTDGDSLPATVSITVDTPPVAVDDPNPSCVDGVTGSPKKYIAIEDQALTVTPPTDCGLLLNDSDPDADSITAAKATNPAHGIVSVTAAGGFTYTPNANYNGLDSFTYTASDGVLQTAATVSLTVLAVDDPPNAVNDTFSVGESSATNPLAVLANDTTAPDAGETISIVGVTQGNDGSVGITGGGSGLTYRPAPLFIGTDFFTYTIVDSGGNPQDTATVTIHVTKDLTPPVVSAPAAAIRTGLSITGTTFGVRVAWTGSDAGVGIARFELQRQLDSGAWTAQTIATPLTTSVNPVFTAGHRFRYRVRAIDKNGNVSAWRYSVFMNASLYQETAAQVTYTGAWAISSNVSYSGGQTKYGYGVGKSATFTVTARDVAFVAPISSARGSIRIYVDGVLAATVSEHGSTTIYRRVLWSRHFSTLVSHSIRVVLVGDGRIDIDAFLALR